MVERELSKADMESEEAMKALSERLDNKPSVVSKMHLYLAQLSPMLATLLSHLQIQLLERDQLKF